MYEFEKHPKLTEFIQEMANTGRVPQEWTTFLETLNQALRIHDVVVRSEQLVCYKKCGDTQPYNDICLNCGSSINYNAN